MQQPLDVATVVQFRQTLVAAFCSMQVFEGRTITGLHAVCADGSSQMNLRNKL
jgi:hypothetical protein